MSPPAPLSARKNVSAFERLSRMPAIFSLNTLVRWTGLTRESAKVMVSRWAARGMVESAGPRAGLYFNRVVDPRGEQVATVNALVMKYPSATLCGVSVVHAAGWTTQIPSTLHVAIEARESYAQLNGVTLWPRPIKWFRDMQERGAWYGQAGRMSQMDKLDKLDKMSPTPADDEMPTYGLRALKPAWALADLFADGNPHAWHPDEDDLDIPDEAVADVAGACSDLGASPDWLQERLTGMVPQRYRPR